MILKYRFELDKGSAKYTCVKCARKSLVRYIDTATGKLLPKEYGRCDRETNCSYHLNPYKDGFAYHISNRKDMPSASGKNKLQPNNQELASKVTEKFIYFDTVTFRQTLKSSRYEKNSFIQNLLHKVTFPFEPDDITKVIQLYSLGTISKGYRSGAVTFPFIDALERIRAVQVKQFDDKNTTVATDFLHSIIEKECKRNRLKVPDWIVDYKSQPKLVTCLFGEHLLSKYPNNPVGLVEAPKSAIYCSLYFGFPESTEQLIWLAVYNKSSFTFDKLQALRGRSVFVFPDLSEEGKTYKEWEAKWIALKSKLPGTRFVFSDLLESLATAQDKRKGYDIADYLIRLDWRQFRKKLYPEQSYMSKSMESILNIKYESSENEITKSEVSAESVARQTEFFLPATSGNRSSNESVNMPCVQQEINWRKEVNELELFFSTFSLPKSPIKINTHSTITDVKLFIRSHIATIKANEGKRSFMPYLIRLKQLRGYLRENFNDE
jgi:hypothetical protein